MYNAKETAKTESFITNLSNLPSDVKEVIREIIDGKSIELNQGTIFYNKNKERFIYRKEPPRSRVYEKLFPSLYAYMLKERTYSIELTPDQLVDYVSNYSNNENV